MESGHKKFKIRKFGKNEKIKEMLQSLKCEFASF